MEGNINIGRIRGIPIGLHFSWFFIFALFTWSLAVGYFPEEYPELTPSAYWVLGMITSLLLFGSVLVHELAHALVALRNQIPVHNISLFIFGGVAQLTQEPRSAGAEFRIAIAGPLASFGLALLFGGLYLLDQHIPYLAAPSLWLARLNLLLAVFNLIPGFPLDGGRILRAAIWGYSDNLYRATQVASITGQVIAFGFIGLGILTMFYFSFFDGLWLVLIGWFLQNAAAATHVQANLKRALHGVKVGQVMNRDLPRVPSLLPLSQLVDEQVMAGGGRSYFFVSDSGQPEGVLSLQDIAAIPQRKWRFMTTRQAMVPLSRLVSVSPETDLVEALRLMDEQKLSQLPVVELQQVIGVLTRETVEQYLELRTKLNLGGSY